MNLKKPDAPILTGLLYMIILDRIWHLALGKTSAEVASRYEWLTIIQNAGPPLPECPFGVPLLAIFMVLAYAVIRRKTRN